MRKWHRWLSLFFGVILWWVAVTGVLSQIPQLAEAFGGGEGDRAQAAQAAPAGFKCPETMMCRPKPPQGGLNIGLIHHLHSGESFGPVGVVLFSLAGFAMVFFSFSGLWLYVQMWRFRKDRGLNPKWLWE